MMVGGKFDMVSFDLDLKGGWPSCHIWPWLEVLAGWLGNGTGWPCGPGGPRAAPHPRAGGGLGEDTHQQQHESPSEERGPCQSPILSISGTGQNNTEFLSFLCEQCVHVGLRLQGRRCARGTGLGKGELAGVGMHYTLRKSQLLLEWVI